MVSGKITRKLWQKSMAVVIIYTAFLVLRNLYTVVVVKHRMRGLIEQKQMYQARIAEDSTMLERLNYDEYLEQYARERFHMQRPNEYIYIME